MVNAKTADEPLTFTDWMDAVIAVPDEPYIRRAFAEWLARQDDPALFDLGQLIEAMQWLDQFPWKEKPGSFDVPSANQFLFYGGAVQGEVPENVRTANDHVAAFEWASASWQHLDASLAASTGVSSIANYAGLAMTAAFLSNPLAGLPKQAGIPLAAHARRSLELIQKNAWKWVPDRLRCWFDRGYLARGDGHRQAHPVTARLRFETPNRVALQIRDALDFGVWYRSGLPYRLDCSLSQLHDFAIYGGMQDWPIEEVNVVASLGPFIPDPFLGKLPRPSSLKVIRLIGVRPEWGVARDWSKRIKMAGRDIEVQCLYGEKS